MGHYGKRKKKYKPQLGDYRQKRFRVIYGYPTSKKKYDMYSPGKLVIWADVI